MMVVQIAEPANTFTDTENSFPMMPAMEDAPRSLLSGSYVYIIFPGDAVRIGGSYGTSPRETQLHIKHMSRGANDPNTIAFRTFASSCSRDATNGTTSLYTSNWMNIGIAHGLQEPIDDADADDDDERKVGSNNV